jgi:membrane-associated phospholipid phosphatase|tara:strand:+ start:64 stop:717 length:654 start_codon:yes stop_codon:yes gene_type:complete
VLKTPFERIFQNMTRPWVMSSYLVLTVLSFIYWDKPITEAVHALDFGQGVIVLKALSWIGLSKAYLIGLPVLALVLHYVFKHIKWAFRTWFLWLCVFVPDLIAVGLKYIFGRARPELLFQEQLYGFQWLKHGHVYHSFPSGHTTTIMGFVFGLCIILPRYRVLFLCLGVAVGISRILLLQHYVSDVMTAAYLALIEVWVLQRVLQRYAPTFIEEIHG